MEMEICAEFIGCWHEDFKAQSLEEQLKWYYYREMKIEYDIHREEERKKKEKSDRNKVQQGRPVKAAKG